MGLLDGSPAIFFFAFLFAGLFSSSIASNYLSDGIFKSHISTGRTLLQVLQGCSASFQYLNYTILTSRCKGPKYPAEECCSTFKELACPYVDLLNNQDNNCASTLFSYINLYGNYPPGLFANECREGKEGLACPPTAPTQSPDSSDSLVASSPRLLLLILTAAVAVLLCSSKL